MSARSKKPSAKPSKRRTKAELSKPIAPKVRAKAKQIAASYTIVVRPEPEVGYFGRTIELPYVMADGPTPEACIASLMEATTAAVAAMLEEKQTPPRPASDARRNAQVNVRLTEVEKFELEEAARRDGFRGLSDFVRAAALDRAG